MSSNAFQILSYLTMCNSFDIIVSLLSHSTIDSIDNTDK